jgi:DNA ligase-1
MDGEITSGTTFQECTSAVMTIEGEPTFKVWLFDYVNPTNPPAGYRERMREMELLEPLNNIDYEILYPIEINNEKELMEYHQQNLDNGYEGTMVRSPNGAYKCGRSTVNEGILLKVKDFTDDECVVIGLEELMSNQNTAEKDAFGRTKRSTHQENQVPMNTLGAFVVSYNGKEFKIGSGLDDETRRTIWDNQEEYIGRTMKFKYFDCGIKELPRHPVFLGWRHSDDMGEPLPFNEKKELGTLEELFLS